jgi:spore germination protein YaaH
MTITTGTAGTNALTSVSDASTNYSITQNFASTVKITANLNSALSAGYTLQLNLASTKGTSAGTVDISATTPASASNVVSNIALGADANQTITYTFGANASAGTLSSTAKVVTLTLTN